MLRDGPADGDPSRAGATDGQMLGRRVLLVDEISRSGDDVVDGVLLRRLLSRDMPLLAELAAPSRVNEDRNSSAFQQRKELRLEERVDRDPVSSVTR
jgi:hypothetical protein